MYLYLKGLWWESGGANGRESDRTGWVESQQVVEGGGIYKCECGSRAKGLIKDDNYMFRPIAAIIRFSSGSMVVVLYRIGMVMSRW